MFWDEVRLRLQSHFSDEELNNYVNQLSSTSNIPKAAILIPLFEHDGKVYVLFTQRSAKLKSHSGEVCFPGGMADATDENIYQTAQREAFEEIGLRAANVKILGQIVPMVSKHGAMVFPVVALLENLEEIHLKLNSDEVDDVFACPLQYFLTDSHEHVVGSHPNNVRFFSFDWNKDSNSVKKSTVYFLRQVLCDSKYDSHCIWGLTAMYSIIAASVCLNQSPVKGASIPMMASFKKRLNQKLSSLLFKL